MHFYCLSEYSFNFDKNGLTVSLDTFKNQKFFPMCNNWIKKASVNRIGNFKCHFVLIALRSDVSTFIEIEFV